MWIFHASRVGKAIHPLVELLLSCCWRRKRGLPDRPLGHIHTKSVPLVSSRQTCKAQFSPKDLPLLPLLNYFLYLSSLFNTPSTAAAAASVSTSRGRFLLYHSFGPGCSSFLIDNLTLTSSDSRKTTPQNQLLHTNPHNKTSKHPFTREDFRPCLTNDGNFYSLKYIFNSKKERAIRKRLYLTVPPIETRRKDNLCQRTKRRSIILRNHLDSHPTT